MKDLYQIFDESFQAMIALAGKSSYINCFNISVDLTRMSVQSDFKDGIFISEILENIFQQIGPLFDQYKIDEKDVKLIKEQVCEYLVLLSKVYRDEDKTKAYEVLRDLRSMTSQFQFKCWNYLENKRGSSLKRFSRGGES